jgi:hypothetical protein
VLVVVASYYVLFAIMGGSMRALIVESIVMSAFTLAAVIGFKRNLWLVAAGLTAHGTSDLFHASIVMNPCFVAFRLGMIVFRKTVCSSSTNGTRYT